MIVGSLLLILVAIALLVMGLVQGANAMLVASIAASLLAAVALVVGGRQAGADRAARDPGGRRGRVDESYGAMAAVGLADAEHDDGRRSRRAAHREPVGAGVGAAGGTGGGLGAALDETAMIPAVRDDEYGGRNIPQQGGDAGRRRYADEGEEAAEFDDDDEDYEEDPPDEPAAQQVSAGDAARVARLTAEVLVIDGRPRYHLRGCVHLLGRESEPLPVGEAVELGFTPCAVCEPDTAILVAAGHG